jgi:hypothetical protein
VSRARGYPIYSIGTGEDVPLTPKGLRDLRIVIALLIVPVGILISLAIRSLL